MWSLILAGAGKLVGPLVAFLEKYGMAIGAYAKGRQDAANKHRMQDDEHQVEAYKDSARIRDDVRRTPDDKLRQELAKWEQ